MGVCVCHGRRSRLKKLAVLLFNVFGRGGCAACLVPVPHLLHLLVVYVQPVRHLYSQSHLVVVVGLLVGGAGGHSYRFVGEVRALGEGVDCGETPEERENSRAGRDRGVDFFIAVFGWSTHEAASFLVEAKKVCPPVSEGCVRCVVLFFLCVCVAVCCPVGADSRHPPPSSR